MSWLDDARRERDQKSVETQERDRKERTAAEERIIAYFKEEVAPRLPFGVAYWHPVVRTYRVNRNGPYQATLEATIDLGLGGETLVLVVYEEYGKYGLKIKGQGLGQDHYIHDSLGQEFLAWVEDMARVRMNAQARAAEEEARAAARDKEEAAHREYRQAFAVLMVMAETEIHDLAHQVAGTTCPDGCDRKTWAWNRLGVDVIPQDYQFHELGPANKAINAAVEEARENVAALMSLAGQVSAIDHLPRDVTIFKITYPGGGAREDGDLHVDYRTKYALGPMEGARGWWRSIQGDEVVTIFLEIVPPGTLEVQEVLFPAGTPTLELPGQLRFIENLHEGRFSRSIYRAVKPLTEG